MPPDAAPETRRTADRDASASSRLASLPGLRVFRSSIFRVLLAATLLVIGLVVLGLTLARQASQPLETGQFGIDFVDYFRAAERLVAQGTPYAPEMLEGAVSAQGQDRYRYPPPLAQMLAPFVRTPLLPVLAAWLVLQAAAAWLAVWIAASARGARPTFERAVWTAVAVTYFLPVFDSLWKGNVSAFVALAVALGLLGGRLAVIAVVGGMYLKLVPAALGAGLAGQMRRAALPLLAGSAAVAALSVSVSPRAWSDYLKVVPNLFAGSADFATNLAPSAVVARVLADMPGVADVVRIAAIVVAVALLAGGVLAGHRDNGELATTLAVGAMLLAPAALWYHYLAAVLPLAAGAWPVARDRERALLLLAAVATSVGLALLPLALAGASAILAVCGVVFTRTGVRVPSAAAHGAHRQQQPISA